MLQSGNLILAQALIASSAHAHGTLRLHRVSAHFLHQLGERRQGDAPRPTSRFGEKGLKFLLGPSGFLRPKVGAGDVHFRVFMDAF